MNLKEIKRCLDRKLLMINHQKLVEAVKQARKDREEGNAITLATPEEMKNWFSKMIEIMKIDFSPGFKSPIRNYLPEDLILPLLFSKKYYCFLKILEIQY